MPLPINLDQVMDLALLGLLWFGQVTPPPGSNLSKEVFAPYPIIVLESSILGRFVSLPTVLSSLHPESFILQLY